MYDWGDLRFLLATARTGSTSAAASELGVNQTTVARRIASLEAHLGVPLFERRQDGYRLTEAGAALRNKRNACRPRQRPWRNSLPNMCAASRVWCG